MPLFCIPELGILASLPVQSMLFSIRDVLHHPDSYRCHDSLLPSSAIPLPVYIVQQSAVLFWVFIHKLAASGRLI
jgi:hypothetical protein